MRKMMILVGLPACGKTSFAHQFVAENPDYVVIERDQIRFMMYGKYYGPPIDEDQITRVQQGFINSVFKKHGKVIISDTNLNRSIVKALVQLAQRWGAEVEFKYFDVDPEICIQRDAQRAKQVGADVIRQKAKRFVKGDHTVPRFDDLITHSGQIRLPYMPGGMKPEAIIVDLDGTIAIHNRNPHDYHLLNTDSPNHSIIRIVQEEWNRGTTILYTSGRPDWFKFDGQYFNTREMSINWIDEHVGMCVGYNSDCELFMRSGDDKRMDAIVKYELFDQFIRNNYHVKYCLDDRRQVIDMWRSIGLTVLDVAGHDF